MESCFDKIYNSFLNGKMGHAFLIETNDIEQTSKKILDLVKKINCPQFYQPNCSSDCDICFQIDNLCLPSIKFVEPSGQAIKKEQIIELKNKFNSNSMIIKYNVYIIKNAEKLNSSSANVLLKFLEDPGTETIAFFVLSNKKNIISTIKSRCQIYKDESNQITDLNEELISLFELKAKTIFENILKEKSMSFLKNKELVILDLKNKPEQELFFNYIFQKISKEIEFRMVNNIESENIIFKAYQTRTLIDLAKKTKEIIEKVSYNVNIELLLDDYFIKIGELMQ